MPYAVHVFLLTALRYTGRECRAAEGKNNQHRHVYDCAQYAPFNSDWMMLHLISPFTQFFWAIYTSNNAVYGLDVSYIRGVELLAKPNSTAVRQTLVLYDQSAQIAMRRRTIIRSVGRCRVPPAPFPLALPIWFSLRRRSSRNPARRA